MPVRRHFLGWDGSMPQRVAEFLLRPRLGVPTDAGDLLVVVPTRQAGRRLRESLGEFCADEKTGLLSPRVVTPSFFTRGEQSPEAAGEFAIWLVWADVLSKSDISAYTGLFPCARPNRDLDWAFRTGRMIQDLREDLADGGYLVADVAEGCGGQVAEPDRWRDLQNLERAYLDRLGELGLEDPCIAGIKRAQCPTVPPGVAGIVVAAVPDPSLLMTRALQRLSESLPVDVLIHAPPEKNDHFDEWGRPVAETWLAACLDIPDWEQNLVLVEGPDSQSRQVLDLLVGENRRFGPADTAIGVVDGEVIPLLKAEIRRRGLSAFDPAGTALREHPLWQLLDAYRCLVGDGSYAALSALLRHPDFLRLLGERHDVSPRDVLAELDRFQNRHLPSTLDEVAACLEPCLSGKEAEFSHLASAVAVMKDHLTRWRRREATRAALDVLQTVYSVRRLDSQVPEDREFVAAAQEVEKSLREFDGELVERLGLDPSAVLGLFLQGLGSRRYFPEHEPGAIDLEGWLELAWNPAPLLIVTGMNEGRVPAASPGDPFLPDSLRRRLGLRSDTSRFCRDIYLMCVLIESRRRCGRVCFVAGRRSGVGDPLKPSRLLFRCRDEELPSRAVRLFGTPQGKRHHYPHTVSFRWDARPRQPWPEIPCLHVTAFRDYLECPFRFYLKHILRMETLTDGKWEPDALDFGSLVHHALQRMAQSRRLRRCEDPEPLRKFLWSAAGQWVKERFGASPSLSVVMVHEAARQRLSAAADVQGQLVREGWEILAAEKEIQGMIGGLIVKGRIDRIDRQRDTGRVRILDYKTSDAAESPPDTHLSRRRADALPDSMVQWNGKEWSWIDLQLPLYQILRGEDWNGGEQPVETGYFNLPKAVRETRVDMWEGFDETLLKSAESCAQAVVDAVRHRRFWPPSPRVPHPDDFESLLSTEWGERIDGELFRGVLEGAS